MTAFAPATILIQHFLSPLTLKDKEKINIYLFACINLIRCKIPFVLIIVRSVKFLTIASLISHLSFQSKCDQKQCQCCQQEFSSQHCPPKPLTPPLISPFANFLEGHGQLMRTGGAPGCPVPTHRPVPTLSVSAADVSGIF